MWRCVCVYIYTCVYIKAELKVFFHHLKAKCQYTEKFRLVKSNLQLNGGVIWIQTCMYICISDKHIFLAVKIHAYKKNPINIEAYKLHCFAHNTAAK